MKLKSGHLELRFSVFFMRNKTRHFTQVKKKAKIRNLHNQVPHLNRDTIWESDKTRKHHTQES